MKLSQDQTSPSCLLIAQNHLSETQGGIIRGADKQPYWDYFAVFPGNIGNTFSFVFLLIPVYLDKQIATTVVFLQAKHKSPLDPSTGYQTEYSKLDTTTINKVSEYLIDEVGKENPNLNFIVEFVSPKPLSTTREYLPEDQVSVISEVQWRDSLGILSQHELYYRKSVVESVSVFSTFMILKC